jgi:hypothetical protein
VKPFQVIIEFSKNVAALGRPPVFELRTRTVTVWAPSSFDAARLARTRHGGWAVSVFLPAEWSDVKF